MITGGKMNKKYLIAGAFMLILICMEQGCVSRKEIMKQENLALIQSQKKRIKNTLPTCFSKSECEMKWAAAKKWVTMDPRRKIKFYTDSFIETYEPSPDSTGLAVQIVKEALPQGGYKFVLNTKCYHQFGCNPSKIDAELDFNEYINIGKSKKASLFEQQPDGMKTKLKDSVLKKTEEYKGKSKLSLPDLSDKVSLPK